LEDNRPWLVGLSCGKDNSMVPSLASGAALAVSPEKNKKRIAILCTEGLVETRAGAEGVESTLERTRRCSQQHSRRQVKPCASAAKGECPIQIDTSRPSCANPWFRRKHLPRRFGDTCENAQ
jgi:hypothetical protein